MEKEVKGIVKQNPIVLAPGSVFVVEQENELYLIVSTDIQATKDNIFVEQGQEITIQGSYIEIENLKGVLSTSKAKITLDRTNEERQKINKKEHKGWNQTKN